MKGRRVPGAEKVAILADAIATSAPSAAARWGVSEHAIWKWAEEEGGLRRLRELYEIRRIGAVSEVAVSISKEVQRRAGKLSEANLVALAVELIKSLGYAGGHTTTIVNAPQARAEVQAARVHDDPDRVGTIIRILAEAGVLLAPPPDGSGNAL